MKKKQILAMGMSAVLLCTSVAFAAPSTQASTVGQQQPVTMPAAKESFRLGSMATVKEMQDSESILVTTEQGQDILLKLNEDTKVVDNETGNLASMQDIQVGDEIFVYYSAIMTRSLPPQSVCELILTHIEKDKTAASLHEVGTITKEEDGKTAILTADGGMIVRVDDQTKFMPLGTKEVVTVDDLKEDTRFLAWYDIVLTSYPGQTYSNRIVILPTVQSTEQSGETKTRTKRGVSVDGKVMNTEGEMINGVAVIPVRVVAEALGCTVSYEQKNGKEFVTVENDTRKMTLEIGQDLYVSTTKIENAVGMTAPVSYQVAPYIQNDTVYAAAEMFEALVGFDVSVDDQMISITTKK